MVLSDSYVCDVTIEIGMNVIIIKIKEVEKNYGSGNLEKEEVRDTGVPKEYFWVLVIFDLFLDHDYRMYTL